MASCGCLGLSERRGERGGRETRDDEDEEREPKRGEEEEGEGRRKKPGQNVHKVLDLFRKCRS